MIYGYRKKVFLSMVVSLLCCLIGVCTIIKYHLVGSIIIILSVVIALVALFVL